MAFDFAEPSEAAYRRIGESAAEVVPRQFATRGGARFEAGEFDTTEGGLSVISGLKHQTTTAGGGSRRRPSALLTA